MGMERSTLRPDRFTSQKESRYPWNRRLGGPQRRSGSFEIRTPYSAPHSLVARTVKSAWSVEFSLTCSTVWRGELAYRFIPDYVKCKHCSSLTYTRRYSLKMRPYVCRVCPSLLTPVDCANCASISVYIYFASTGAFWRPLNINPYSPTMSNE